MAANKRKRDREITREIHRLFWKANLHNKFGVITCLLLRIPAFAATHILMPFTVAYGLQAIIERDFDTTVKLAWVIVMLAVGFGILWTISGIIISRHGATAGVYLQRLVFANFLNKDYDFYSNTYFGSLGAQAMRLREAFNEEYNVIMFIYIPRQLTIVLGGIGLIALQSVTLALVTLLAMAAVLSFTIASSTWRLKWRRKVSELNSDVAGFVGDALTGATAVKSFANESYEEKRLHDSLLPWANAQYKAWVTAIPADSGRHFLIAVVTAILLIMTANMYKNGAISIATVALIQLYVIKMVAVAGDITENIKMYEHGMGGAYQPVRTMLIQPNIKDKPMTKKLPKSRHYPIVFDEVSFRYTDAAKNNFAIKDFALEIAPGEKIGLVGYSGSGKTTLTKLLLRFMDVSSGQIAINGLDVRDLAQNHLRQKIAYVPQEPLLFHRSIFENIAYGRPEASKKEVLAAAKMAHVDEFVQDLPKSYDTLVGERGVKLSGGQRQRVAIARAILREASVLVLDEATSALDSRSELFIQKALASLMEDRTALVIAHRLSTIQRMDRIVVMDKGQIVQTGTHKELLKDKTGIYAELWAHQSGGYIGVPDEGEE
jgi:ATP-binding cassette subfamily B protein